MAEKTLYLLRHAKAEPASLAKADKDRRLTERGLVDAARLGAFARETGMVFSQALCSGAVRTRETLAAFGEQFGANIPTEFADTLYHASASAMLEHIRQVEDSVPHVLVVGHNPGIHQLAAQLAETGERTALEEVALHYPTCTLSVLRFTGGAWADIAPHRGELLHFLTPAALQHEALSGVA